MSEKWSSEVVWQKDSNYIIHCIEEAFELSKSGDNPQIRLKFEVYSPETMEVAGVPYVIAGVSAGLTKYMPVLDKGGDTEKTKRNQSLIEEMYKRFGIKIDGAIDWENPPLGFKGKHVYALLTNNQTEQRKSPTKEQLAKGIKQGDVLLNPVTKKPLVQNYPNIGDIYGIAPTDLNKPY